MRYISVFSGIEAASVAWQPLGWEPVAFSEIEPFPCAVLAHYYPNVPNLGDISKVDWRKYHGSVDLVVGGSPCQSFSTAGKREGLDGASGLVREYFRLLSEVKPRYFVWENVPGALSSGTPKGSDFLFILRQWSDIGYHVAWRILDAQYFGVPQRRRRVFAVGCLDSWQYPAKVLFERESLRRDTAKSGKAREGDTAGTEEGISCTVTSKWHKGSGGPSGNECQNLVCATLVATGQGVSRPAGCANEFDYCVLSQNQCGELRQSAISGTIGTNSNASGRAVQIVMSQYPRTGNQGSVVDALVVSPSVTPPITTKWAREGWTAYDETAPLAVIQPQQCVRRLTPLECERLQGFPDNYTDIEFKGKPAPDGARYKALGNSMAVPVMRWIGERIQKVEDGEL